MFIIRFFPKHSPLNENFRSIIIIYSTAYFLLYTLFFFIKNKLRNEIHESSEITKYEQKELFIDKNYKPGKIDEAITNRISLFSPSGIDFINRSLDQNSLSKAVVINNADNIFSDNCSSEVIIVDTRLNDIKNLNAFLGNGYNKLTAGGYLIILYEELSVFEKRFCRARNSFIALIKKTFYYLYFRALPKIKWATSIFRLISGGKNNVLSKAEIWGRLVYAGFDIINNFNDERLSYTIAQKALESSKNPNPSYYPVITLDRVGFLGKIIKIHKVRSMYPYSEFIQKKVFENSNLSSIGKFENDFRITEFGKYFRKYWIDELPQFYDWFRGEIKLVGIRALSQHFFNLYPKEYQELFIKVKPGIISPVFDENTDGFKEIIKIEQKYLESYLRNPVLTDIKYFFITLSQIFAGVRSK
jgi:Sugar transferases involved in lipopolysaccharide synthesis